ncbi:hypothetical protein scyTo_0008648 [Scyliorhinus torazame]|uniref:CRAL/TRIO N-terminal domain-containing protein n=1 Tax=Scyliorhinus torazame TaxID=75743 RepID=A0A401PC44_SCYTO|nr:hypothetical protein [Scyliorhinus torazame]
MSAECNPQGGQPGPSEEQLYSDSMLGSISELRLRALKQSPDWPLGLENGFLLKFLRARDFDIELALKVRRQEEADQEGGEKLARTGQGREGVCGEVIECEMPNSRSAIEQRTESIAF